MDSKSDAMSVGDEERCDVGVNVSPDEISSDTQQLRKWTDRENKFHASVRRRCVTFFVTRTCWLVCASRIHTRTVYYESRVCIYTHTYIYIYGSEFIIQTVAGRQARLRETYLSLRGRVIKVSTNQYFTQLRTYGEKHLP